MSLNLLKQELRDFKSNLLEMSMEKNLHEDELIKLVDSSITKENITVDSFKDFVLELERNNLKNISKEDKKTMVAKIIRTYEEAKKDGNK